MTASELFADDLAPAGVHAARPGDTWLPDGTWKRPSWTLDELQAAKAGRTISVVLPALERLRDTLRQRGTRVRPVRDTLGKAVAGLASAGSAPSDSTGAASSS